MVPTIVSEGRADVILIGAQAWQQRKDEGKRPPAAPRGGGKAA
jgi:hypothetical protein